MASPGRVLAPFCVAGLIACAGPEPQPSAPDTRAEETDDAPWLETDAGDFPCPTSGEPAPYAGPVCVEIEETWRSDGAREERETRLVDPGGRVRSSETTRYFTHSESTGWTTWLYDADERLLATASTDESGGAPGCASWSYDGPTATEEWDGDGDGVPDWRGTSTYDADGNLLSFASDWLVDGPYELDYADAYTYDDAGRLLTSLVHVPLSGYGGGYSDFSAYSYDGRGRLARVDVDLTHDGDVDFARTYVYDADDRLLLEQREGPTGEVHARVAYTYDARGNLVQEVVDEGADEVVDEVWTYTYEVDQLISEVLTDEVGDVVVSYAQAWDADGNLVLRERRDEAGMLTYRATWDPSCLP